MVGGELATGELIEVRARVSGGVDGREIEAGDRFVDLCRLLGFILGSFGCICLGPGGHGEQERGGRYGDLALRVWHFFVLHLPLPSLFHLQSSSFCTIRRCEPRKPDRVASHWRPLAVCERVVSSALSGYVSPLMSVPCIIPVSLRFRKLSSHFLLMVALVFVTNCGWAKGPEPLQKIALAPLGFQTPLNQFMLAGSSMMTVDFVDPKHLLFTFSTKRLLKRLSECPPADQDRVVEAVFLELPSGKILARTSWRTHDHGQYLWNLGRGRFMLRIRDALSTFAPMVNLSKGDAFVQLPLLRTDRRIGGFFFP